MGNYAYYYNRAKTYLDQGDSGRALINFTSAKLQNPNRVDAYYARAKVHQLRGNRDRADADLTTAQNLTIISFAEFDLTKANEFVESDTGLSLIENEDANPDDILIGKLGEIAFAKFLYKHDKAFLNDADQLLTWDDVYTLDRLNLQTCDGKTVDVKASENRGSRLIQTPDGDEISIRFQSILVPCDNEPRDYYVGVGISKDKTIGTVEGFIDRDGLHPSEHYIPDPCLQRKFGSLKCIGDLLEMMPEAENSGS